MDLIFSTYDFQKNGEQITGYSISEINKTYQILMYRDGINRIKFKYYNKTFLAFYHIVRSIVIVQVANHYGGDNNHCKCSINTTDDISSDEEEQIEKH